MARKATTTAKRTDTEGAAGAGQPAVPQNATPATTSQDGVAAGGGGDLVLSATHTEGENGAGKPADTPQVPAEGHTAGQGGEAASLPADNSGALGNGEAPAGGAGGDGGPVDPALDRRFAWPNRIRVVGPEKGRRRAGMRFSREPVDLDLADLTDEALAALDADPELKITAADT